MSTNLACFLNLCIVRAVIGLSGILVKHTDEKNFAFIDSQNLYKSLQELGWQMDWARFRKYLEDKYKVQRAFYFIGFMPTNADLYAKLQEAGFILVFKPTLEVRGKIKGNVDAELVLQVMVEIENFDKAVIVSGDGDFHCLVKYLAGKNKLKKLLVPNDKKFSSLYRKYGLYIAGINNLRRKLAR
jgi:uncharacterized LabA/DUF88 family protein